MSGHGTILPGRSSADPPEKQPCQAVPELLTLQLQPSKLMPQALELLLQGRRGSQPGLLSWLQQLMVQSSLQACALAF